MSGLPKILCVDDDAPTLDALERVLRKDFHVLRAGTGAEGLKQVQSHLDLAILLSDYRMPQMTGVEFLNRAKEYVPLATRAILTGQMDLTDLMTAVNSQAIHRLILKPWDNDYLIVQMRESLQNHQLLLQKSELEKLSITDPVTSVSNHRHFQECLRREMERAHRHNRPLSLLMIDVDHFKAFNDRFGHPEGDKLLFKIAQHIRGDVRTIDLVFRYGGEEFAVILPDTNPEDARKAAERLRESLAAAKLGAIQVTASIGVASITDTTSTTESLIQFADQAMYQAKRSGRNRVH
jgi:two-component system cell cycle response regulator